MRDEGRSHSEMAHEIYDLIKRADRHAPLADGGALYRLDRNSGLWLRHELEDLARFVGDAINERNCKRVADYRGVATLTYSQARDGIAHDASPFDGAPPGIAANGMFYHLNGEGVERVKLAPEHLARFAVPVAPDQTHPRPLFNGLLAASFPETDQDHREQRLLLGQHFGAYVIGTAARMQRAMLWRGAERSGKSTLQAIMRSMFKAENVSAIPPHLWYHEYHVAALAGKVLNTVGEVNDKRPLDVSFKNVIGRDLLHGRHVTLRPFAFRNEAGHFSPATASRRPRTTATLFGTAGPASSLGTLAWRKSATICSPRRSSRASYLPCSPMHLTARSHSPRTAAGSSRRLRILR